MSAVAASNPYQRAADALGATADQLRAAAQRAIEHDAVGKVIEAGVHASSAATHFRTALDNGAVSFDHFVKGTASALEAVRHAAAAVAVGTVATAGWVAEKAMGAARLAFINIAKFFVGAANWLGKAIAHPEKVKLETQILGDPTAKTFSQRMFDKARNHVRLSKEALGYSWDKYVDAARAAATSATNAAHSALHSGAVLTDLGMAALHAGSAGAVRLAELGVRAARFGVVAAEGGVELAREGAILSAEITAALANALARADQNKVEISREMITQLEARLSALEARAAA